MKETFKNLKKVYNLGKEYRKYLYGFNIATCFGIAFNIIVPILAAKQIVYLTNNQEEQLLLATLMILVIGIIDAIKTIVIRSNTQQFFRGITSKIQNILGRQMLKITLKDIDSTSSGAFI